MADINQRLTQQLLDRELPQISRQIGADQDTTGQALSAVVPLLLSALAHNTAQPQGAQALHTALAEDHDGTIFNNMDGFLSDPQAARGAAILRHILGERREVVQQWLAEVTGLEPASVGQLLEIAAPLVLGALGQQQQQEELNPDGLSTLLDQQQQVDQARNPDFMSMVSDLLDVNNDGNALDDIFRWARRLFGGR
jgi:hypothetical protein